MATAARLRYSPLAGYFRYSDLSHTCRLPGFASPPKLPLANSQFCPLRSSTSNTTQLYSSVVPKLQAPCAGGGGGGVSGVGRGGDDGGNGRWSGGSGNGGESRDDANSSPAGFGPIEAFLNGWRSRVAADPQFPFKVLMEELVGVSACVLGDMASRPNFGPNELDFMFSTLVGSILNFVLMYLLPPTAASAIQTLPFIFESGPYSLMNGFGTFVYKGTLFAAVGFAVGVGAVGLVGTIRCLYEVSAVLESLSKLLVAVIFVGVCFLIF